MLSNLFILISHTLSICASIISLVVSLLMIFIICKNQPLRTFNNLLLCNSCVAVICYSIVNIIESVLGFHDDWILNAPFCSLRGFCLNTCIALICYSKAIHTISRFFCAVLYKHRFLLTWRTHWILIIFNWILALIICIPPFFINDGYQLEIESRRCVISSKKYWLALYITIISCLLPFNIIAMVYISIAFHVHRSTRRVWAVQLNNHQINPKTCHIKREISIMKQMLIQTSALLPGGPLFLILIIWNATLTHPPPEILYPLGFEMMTLAVFIVTIVHFVMSKKVKESTIEYLSHIVHFNDIN